MRGKWLPIRSPTKRFFVHVPSNFTEKQNKSKSPALRGMSFFIVFVQRRQHRPLLGLSVQRRRRRRLLGLSVRLRVHLVVVGLDIVAPHCLMMIAAVAARCIHLPVRGAVVVMLCYGSSRPVPRLQPVVVAAVVHVFYARFVRRLVSTCAEG